MGANPTCVGPSGRLRDTSLPDGSARGEGRVETSDTFVTSFISYLERRADHLLELALAHATVVALALLVAAVLGIGVGVAVRAHERSAEAALAVAGTFLTVPSYALIGLLVPALGLGYAPTIVALAMYALLPILRNTLAGLRSVDPAVVECARGLGMGDRERLMRVELPLAWPVILAGLRVATVLIVGIAAIAAAVNGPGLGEDIFVGLARIGSASALNYVLGGMLGVVVLAILFDAAYAGLARITTSRGIRG